jgi:DNA-directed DNA polymerase III PolC
MTKTLGPDFTHLHVHSTYSLLGATATVEELVARASSNGFTRLALTDSNALYGAVAFSRACVEAGIQPILGMTVNVDALGLISGVEAGEVGQLVMLATDHEGYRSLCRLTSRLQASPNRDALIAGGLNWEDIQSNSRGLICLSGGRKGWIERHLKRGDHKIAHQFVGRLAEVYGDKLFLSIELHKSEDEPIAREIVAIGASLGVPSVAVQPVYSIESGDQARLRLLAAIDQNCTVDQVSDTSLPSSGDPDVSVHWLSHEEIASRFTKFPESLETVGRIARSCHSSLPRGDPIWPVLKLPEGKTPDDVLAEAANQGLLEKFGPDPSSRSTERLENELESIKHHGFAPLFLIVADIVRFAHEVDLPVGTRGSVANSLVAYCAGITVVNPLEHNLPFERFLNPARKDLPDIDLDFCSRRRDEVLEYVRRTYGSEKVALVATVSTMRPRSAVRETAKAYGLAEQKINDLARLVPRGFRRQVTLDDVLKRVTDVHIQEVVRRAFSIVGQPHHLSLHPGGVVITPGSLTDVVPLQWSPKGFRITQFGHLDVEAIGLPKLDLLGIRALTVLADTVDLVRKHHDPSFNLDQIPYDDKSTGDLLAGGQSIGVFQCESFGALRTLRRIKARTIRDLAVANAFFRPGPMMGGKAQSFYRRFRGEEPVTYTHPSLEPILGVTKGIIVFQEQILSISREIAGFSWEEADRIRRGISKLDASDLEEVADQFIQGCMRSPPDGHGFSSGEAADLWDQVNAFSGFGFNQGHATAYAHVSYRSAYMKAHWPEAFLCARLADRGGYHHPAVYIAEAMRLGQCIRPPHINQSGAKFTLTYENEGEGGAPCLWMGLDQVRDLRKSVIRSIIEEREREPFQDLRDLMMRVSLQAKEILHLIQSGGLDGLGESRAAMLAEAEGIKSSGSESQMTFGFTSQPVPEESAAQAMAWERRVLGQPVSVHPLDLVEVVPDHVALGKLSEHVGEMVSLVGVRLPGWTGGGGFYFSDRNTFVLVQAEDTLRLPEVWKPVHLTGRWQTDGMDTYWLQAERIRMLPVSMP